jgi:hypothetical protein
MILDSEPKAIEGLVVNLGEGGIGFRNHTVPDPTEYGSSWTEDLLFIQPETKCVTMNLTLDFTFANLSKLKSEAYSDLVLTDRGGFANISPTRPQVQYASSQADPDLESRAYAAAWVSNVLAMMYLNVTKRDPGVFRYLNSEVGKTFSLSNDDTSMAYDAWTVTTLWADDFLGSSKNSSLNSTKYSNPFHITSSNFTQASECLFFVFVCV